MNIVENAKKLANKYHHGQLYGVHPYTFHLLDVVQSLKEKHGGGADPVLIATAWLHDILEDTECQWAELVDNVGISVATAVMWLTKNADISYENYIKQIKTCPIALEVKTHDSLCNLTASVMSGENGRIRKYSKQLQLLLGE